MQGSGGQRVAAGGAGRKAVYRLVLEMVRPYRGRLAVALVLMLGQSAAMLVLPWLAGVFSDSVLQGQRVGPLLLLAFGLITAQAALSYVTMVLTQGVAVRLVADASPRVFDHLQSLPLGWHQDRRRGDVLSLLVADTQRLGQFVTGTLVPLLPLLVTCIGAFVIMMDIEPRIGLALAVLAPVICLGLLLVGRRLRPLAHETMQAHATKSALAEQNLAMMPVVKAYLGEAGESRRFAEHNHGLRELEMRQLRLQGAIGPTVQVVAAGSVLLLLWLGGRNVMAGGMAAGELVSLIFYGLLLAGPVSRLANVYGQVQTARGTARRLVDAFAAAPEPAGGTRGLERLRGDIAFEAVRFSYPGRPVVLDGLDLRVQAGETIAITGVNGAGKSSLVHLLMRFADPDGGAVRVDGVDIREFTLPSLRAQIGLVSQNVLLFNASVADNIAYGVPGATMGMVQAAARLARADDFIQMLPDGYDTVVGDQGIRLSGGQKQRLALARALIKDPAILVLDEATAMFDPAGEQEFISHCRDMMALRTVILITHRPASLALADRILRMEDGRLV